MANKSTKRLAVITGSARGIGQAAAVALAKRGENIALLDLDEATETAELVREAGGEAAIVKADVTSEQAWNRAREGVREQFGRADTLINGAGIYPFVPFDALDYATWSVVHRVNLDGVFLGCRTFAPLMAENGWGRILNFATASMLSEVPGFSHYVSSKMAVIGLSRTMANELGGRGINVNVLAPSVTETPGTAMAPDELKRATWSRQPIARMLTTADTVGPILFFTGDDCAMVTGQTLLVDGGGAKL